MISTQDRKRLIESLDAGRRRLAIERASLKALEINVKNLEDITTRPGFLKRPDEKRTTFIRRLATARTQLRSKANDVANIEAELRNINSRLAG